MKILFLAPSRTSPSARYRVLQFVRPLQQMGHYVSVRDVRPDRYWQSSLQNRVFRRLHNRIATVTRIVTAVSALRDAERFDVIFMNRDLLPEIRLRWLEPWLARRNPRLIFDLDDAIFFGSRESKLRHILPYFAAVTVGNENLARYVRRWNPRVAVLPTVVATDYYRPVKRRRQGPLRIGWSGSAGPMREHLPLVSHALCSLARERPFEFLVICNQRPDFSWPDGRLRFLPWNPATEAKDLQEIDIGLMPLPDRSFEACKCGAKAILYMAMGIPAVVSPVGVNRQIVLHGETGFHCTTEAEWREALLALLDNPALRRRYGEAGRRRAVAHYSRQVWLPALLELFERVSREAVAGCESVFYDTNVPQPFSQHTRR